MREEIIDILHQCTTGKISIDYAATELEVLFDNNQVGQQMTIFDTITEVSQNTTETTTGKKPSFENVEFKGDEYIPEFDQARLTGQLKRIYDLMIDGKWRTLREISDITNDPEASISAQLRNLRKPKLGSHIVNNRRRGEKTKGLFEYQLMKPEE